MTKTMGTRMGGTTDLADFLLSIGVDVRRSGQEISARCPVHLARTGKADRSPSWSMNSETGLWICYSCGARGTLQSLVREMTGDDSVDANAMLMNSMVENLDKPKVEHRVEADIHAYLRFSPVPTPMLNARNLSKESAHHYGLRWDSANKAWIIPIVSHENKFMGWQEKGSTYTFNHPTGVKKGETLFGIMQVRNHKTILVVESPLDVVRFHSSFDGMAAVATYGAQVTKQQVHILSSIAERLIIAMDNDDAGKASGQKMSKEMPYLRGGLHWLKYSHTKAKDIGDMTDDEIHEAIMGCSVIPWWL